MQVNKLYFTKNGATYIRHTEKPKGEYIEKRQIIADEGKRLQKGRLLVKRTICKPEDLENWAEVDEPTAAAEE